MLQWNKKTLVHPYTHKLRSSYATNQRIHVIIETKLKYTLMINHFCFIMGDANSLKYTKTLFCLFYLVFLNHVKTHLWMIMINIQVITQYTHLITW